MKRCAVLGTSLLAFSLSSAAHATDVSQPKPGLTLALGANDALVIADLCADGVSVRATRYDERKATPSEWAQKPSVQAEASINADFFDFPGWTLVNGRARGAGQDWPDNKMFFESRTYWQFGPNLAGLVDAAMAPAPAPAITEIVGGHNVIISGGKSHAPKFDGDGVILTSHRRTAVGLSADKRFLYLMVSNASLDGTGLADAMLTRAAEAGFPQIDVATNMDGGGSSQMYVAGVGPIYPTGRQVNNHLGVLAKGSGAAPNCPYTPPDGWLDVATCNVIAGWIQSPFAPTASLDGVITYDGVPFGPNTQYQFMKAANHRDDLCKVLGSCEHGYAVPPAYGAMDGKTHEVHAYGFNPNSAGKNAELSGSPKTLPACTPPVPTGRKRWVVNQDVFKSWSFSSYVDVLHVSDDVLATLPDDDDLVVAPSLAQGDDGSPEVYLLDRGHKRHVPSMNAAQNWHFDLGQVQSTPAAVLASIPDGSELRVRPMLAQGSGPKIFLVDDPIVMPSTSGGAGGGTGSSGANGGNGTIASANDASSANGGDCGCRAAGASAKQPIPRWGALTAFAIALGFRAKRRRISRTTRAR